MIILQILVLLYETLLEIYFVLFHPFFIVKVCFLLLVFSVDLLKVLVLFEKLSRFEDFINGKLRNHLTYEGLCVLVLSFLTTNLKLPFQQVIILNFPAFLPRVQELQA